VERPSLLLAGARPTGLNLDFRIKSERKIGATRPQIVDSPSPSDFIRSHSSGKLKFSPEQHYDFSSPVDLVDMGEIGRGNFGTVNRMMHRQSGFEMAVKRIRSTTVNQTDQKRLLMELEAIIKSERCENIVRFYGAIFTEGDCWICMEIMDISLEKLYKCVYEKKQMTLPEELIGHVAVSTLNALNYLKLHLQIIHRDVKPSNILLNLRGFVKLCDFGIAGRLIDSIAKTQDAGCRPYMAPERLSDISPHAYDVRSDVWSLGITLVEIATGRFPFGSWNSVFQQLEEVVSGDPPLMKPGNYSIDMVTFVNNCLIKDKQLRPKYAKLMDYPFYKQYNLTDAGSIERARAMIGAFVSNCLDEK